MYADTLLALERAHLLRLLVWGGACVLLGTLVLALLAARRADSPLLKHFAIQTAAWGAVDLALAGWAWRGLHLRDYDGAAELARTLWLNLGLDVGYVAAGVTIAVMGWVLGRRLAPVGGGLGVVVQGAALLVLDGVLAGRISPYV
jgi:hypothetical protein